MSQVYVDVIGGLGNQLFQLAHALAYGQRTHKAVVCQRTQQAYSVMAPRLVYWDNLWSHLTLADQPPQPLTRLGEAFTYQPLPAVPGHVQLEGYFQDPRYFADYQADILPQLFPAEYQRLAQQLTQAYQEDHYFMHFRRGDYKHLTHFHPLLPLSYYQAASTHFRGRPLIVCEAEDRETIEKEISQDPHFQGYTFIDPVIPDHLQLLMMSALPKGGVIANSTFSWWAAYLGQTQHSQAQYVAPQLWFVEAALNTRTQQQLLLKNWHLI